jgi:DNA-binding response OmpR family regulator
MPYRLLLADDSPTIQKVVELLLSPENFEIKSVNDGEEALRAIDSFRPDIVLADIDMPTIDGYQLCERIKKNPLTSSIAVILLAGAFEPFDKNRAKSVLADDFIIKPFESKELISKVQAVLSNYESLKESIEAELDEEILSGEDIGFDTKEQEILNEEFEAEAAISEGVEKIETSKILDSEKSKESAKKTEVLTKDINIPSAEEISALLQKSINEKVSTLIESNILPYISFTIKDSVESAVSKATPKIIEEIAKSTIKDLLESLKIDIRTTINNVVPQIAEEIIKKEIEKISSESIQ